MSIERPFDLIINAGTSSPLVINVNQNDSGEIWKFNLYQEDGTKVIPAAGEIVGLKSDGHAIVNAGTVNESGQVVITETAQMTAAPGANVFEIVFDSVHGTANFILYVEKSPVDDDADFSESDISAIQQAIAMAISAQTVAALQIALQNEAQTRFEQDTLLRIGGENEAAIRAAADAVLRQAIDDAAIVPAGSTVVVDNTLSIEGAAADAKKTGDAVSDLNQALNVLQTQIISPTLNITENRYINSSGGEGSANGYFYATFPINKGDKVLFTTAHTGTMANISYSQTEDLTFPITPKVVATGTGQLVSYTWVADTDGYAVVSGTLSNYDVRLISTTLYDYIRANNLHTYGTVITSFNYAELLPDLNDADRNSIILIASGLSNIDNSPSGYSGGTVITFCPYANDYTGTIQLFIPTSGNEIIFRNRWASWGSWNAVPRQATIENIISNVTQAQSDINSLLSSASVGAMFSKVLFIGDSLTQGAYYGTPYISKIGKNFPNMFCRLGNIGGNNEGYSGINPIDWYATKKKTSYTDWDLIVLWLGTNDGLTDTLETDVTPYSDYNDYANTNTGCYCKIIESILASNPSANIVMLNCYASSGNLATTNAVLAEIAEKYGLPLYDTSWLSLASDPTYLFHAGVNNPHLGVYGAFVLAHRLWRFIFQYFALHPSLLENGASAEINPTNWTYINR